MAFESNSAVYGLKLHSRAVEAVQASKHTERHQFMVGTCAVRESNELHLLEFDEDSNEITCVSKYSHPPEVLTLGTHAQHGDKVLTTLREGKDFKTCLWKLSEERDESAADLKQLGKLLECKEHQSNTPIRACWNPQQASQLATMDNQSIRLWKLDESSGQAVSKLETKQKQAPVGSGGVGACTWDPHHAMTLAATNGKGLKVWDLRTSKEGQEVPNAHEGLIRDLDYNPNKIHHIVTGGEDCKIRIWDLRKPKKSLRLLGGEGQGHTHWVTSVKYNRFHDQLLLSGATDSSVLLWSVVSVSSAPLGDLEDPTNSKEGDRLLNKYDEHEKSVYGVAWSWFMAWVFASVSWDGRFVISHVPSAEKYKILL
eukprot:gb/GEZN01011590.1/.p1 GENE.gb/GEZN01011590.1/~~gb/GEZN01011590.1/.p1  ORF type:complete len:376 (+),score=42.58 gb/GEZN01011590.1/:22-1128(+)